MKYIKIFENYYSCGRKFSSYNIGDYVLINYHGEKFKVKIIDINDPKTLWNHITKKSNGTRYMVKENEIMRYLLPHERERYEIEEAKFKFNI